MCLSCRELKSLCLLFSKPLVWLGKTFCLLCQKSLTVPYANTLLCIIVMHFWCSLYGILAVRTPTATFSSSACVFLRLPACKQLLCLHAGTVCFRRRFFILRELPLCRRRVLSKARDSCQHRIPFQYPA